jgi:hypothetical protein
MRRGWPAGSRHGGRCRRGERAGVAAHRRQPRIPDAARMDAVFAELADAGWVREAPADVLSVRRKRKDWLVNPALAEALAEEGCP